MLLRHVQTLFDTNGPHSQDSIGPALRVRPLDTDAPDTVMKFAFWVAFEVEKRASNSEVYEDVLVASSTRRPTLRIEMSADGERWMVHSTLGPRERPYLTSVSQMLPFVRVRSLPDGATVQVKAQVLANAPFLLDGGNPVQVRDLSGGGE